MFSLYELKVVSGYEYFSRLKSSLIGVTNTSLSAPWAKSTKSQKQLRVQSMA